MKKINLNLNEKMSPLFVILVVLNTVAMLISNIIACKVFSIGFAVLPCAVIIFPITYVLSDLFGEVYGYKWSRLTAWISFLANIFMVIIFQLAIVIPGVDPSISSAMSSLLGTTPWALASSLIAYMVGDFVNDKIFKRMKERSGEKKFWIRSVLSSFAGELCDSLIYIPLGMLVFPKLFLGIEFMSLQQILIAIPLQAIFKTIYEFIILPITIIVVKKTKKYEENFNITENK